MRPTSVYRKLLNEEAAPFLGLAVDLVRRFMPDAERHATDQLLSLESASASLMLSQGNENTQKPNDTKSFRAFRCYVITSVAKRNE